MKAVNRASARKPSLQPPVGLRLRQRRREHGITQAALSAEVGISPSYLNLIEHGRRAVAGSLLNRLAGALGLDLDEVTGAETLRLVQDLAEVAADPLLSDLKLDGAAAQEIVGRFPAWSRAIVRLHRQYYRASMLTETLADRLAHDPNLLEASHALLTRMTSIRSSSEILREHADINPAQRERFVALIAEESGKLGDIATALFERLSDFGEHARPATPAEEVDDFIIDRHSYFESLEATATRLAARIGSGPSSLGSGAGEEAIVAWLKASHAIRIETREMPEETTRHGALDAVARIFHIPLGTPQASRRFALARLAISLEAEPAIAELVRDQRLTSDAARRQATSALQSYGAGALLFSYDAFRTAAETVHYDLDRLGAIFGGSPEQICHRLVTLRRPGAEGIPFAYLRVDPAGNISKRFSLPTLRLPRYGSACALWPVYRTSATPDALVTQRMRLPNGREFLLVARLVAKSAARFGAPGRRYSIMIACDAAHAARTVYGDALWSGGSPVLEAGINCHVCPRGECPQRAFPRIDAPQEA